jgi:hypothetical protein
MWAFALEMAYGVLCWRVYGGRRALLAMIVLGNLANITLFSASIPGPEQYLAGHPLMVVAMVFVQIVSTLVLIGGLATRTVRDSSSPGALPDRRRSLSYGHSKGLLLRSSAASKGESRHR